MDTTLINKYDYFTGRCLVERLVVDAMKVSPCRPNYLDMRDAIILADRLGRRFADLDDEIERSAQMSIPEIFAAEQEAGFRKRERKCLETLAARPGLVIALGGGAIAQPGAPERVAALSPRRLEVLELVAKGLTNREVAGVLKISEHTAKAHVAGLLHSLDLTNRTEAAVALRDYETSQRLG